MKRPAYSLRWASARIEEAGKIICGAARRANDILFEVDAYLYEKGKRKRRKCKQAKGGRA